MSPSTTRRRSVPRAQLAAAEDERPRCSGPGCRRPLPPPPRNEAGAPLGRPALYCRDVCRKAAYRVKKQQERNAANRAALEAERLADADRRHALAAELAHEAAANPEAFAHVLAAWLDRDPEREWPMQSLSRFLSASQLPGTQSPPRGRRAP